MPDSPKVRKTDIIESVTMRIARQYAPNQFNSKAAKRFRFNKVYAITALLGGILLWFGIDQQRMVDNSLTVQITPQIPGGWRLLSQSNRRVTVTLRASQQDQATLNGAQIVVVPEFPTGAFDNDTFDGTISLSAANVTGLPRGVEVADIDPEVVTVRASRITQRYVPVRVGRIVGVPAEGYAIGRVRPTQPLSLPVEMTAELAARLTPDDVLITDDISVDGQRGIFSSIASIRPFYKDGHTIAAHGSVQVTVEIEEMPGVRTFEQPLEVRPLIEAPYDRYNTLNLTPPSVSVTVAGPRTVIDKLSTSDITVYADMHDRVQAEKGKFTIKCKAICAAPGVRIDRIEPDTVQWILEEPLG